MEELAYFNQLRQSHIILINYIKETIKDKDLMQSCKTGDSTEHLFKNGKYLMTIDWSKV